MWIMMLGARLVSLRLLCTCGVPALLLCLASCASFAEGVTKGLVEAGGETEQRLACEITGPAFDGLEATMARQETARPIAKKGNRNQTTKVMLVHGMGSPEPGYSTRLQHNLTRALGLTVTARRPKEIKLRSPKFHGESLGSVTVWQYLNDSGTRELLFYELNWSEITEQEKQALAYDTSGQYSFKRARFNQYVKQFLNTRISDPVIYTGRSHARILESVVQGSCWMFYTDWEELPDQDTRSCDWLKHAEAEDLAEDEYIYITHSMGSRIVVDTLQQDVEEIDRLLGSDTTPQDRQTGRRVLHAFQDERIRVYMLANQLPLMQLGRDAPQVVGEIDEYCRPGGTKHEKAILKELFVVAFSDPNDVLSYAIPPNYADESMDSRLCPTVVNVSINLVPVTKIFGLGEVANPFEAHEGYDNDPRVIGLIVRGIGQDKVDDAVSEGCTWMRTVE